MNSNALDKKTELVLTVAKAGPTGIAPERAGVQVFLATNDVWRARAVACAVARLIDPERPAPLFSVSGIEPAEHARLFSEAARRSRGEIITRNEQVVALVEGFDEIPRENQRSYAHLVDGEDTRNGLAPGSLLLLHVKNDAQEQIDLGTLDRGYWIDLESA